MNKYNVKAIRTELDGYTRHASWKKFRSRLQGLDLELRRAVIEYRPTATGNNRKRRHSTTLLHSLCDCFHLNPPVPVDLLECIVTACPHLLSGHSSSSHRTPLSIALERQASPVILQCLLMHDTSRESLYVVDKKTGDTPILQSVKQQASDDVILLLVGYDTTKKSLLIPSKKRHRVPLFYVANQELSYVNLDSGEEEIPGEVEYMLLQTHQALRIQNGELVVEPGHGSNNTAAGHLDGETGVLQEGSYGDYIASLDAGLWGDDDDDLQGDCVLFDGDSEQDYCSKLLQAVLACAHFLGDKNSISLISHLLARIPDLSQALDPKGNTILHCFCQAAHTFAQSATLEGRLMTETILRRHEPSLVTANALGNLPLHLALETKKPWDDVIRPLVDAAPETVSIANTLDGRLPLHIAIRNYPSRSREIHNIWKHFPEAATIQDASTRFFPFQLAALSLDEKPAAPKLPCLELEDDVKTTQQPGKAKNRRKPALATTDRSPAPTDLDQLSDIFFLLRACPQVLREYVAL